MKPNSEENADPQHQCIEIVNTDLLQGKQRSICCLIAHSSLLKKLLCGTVTAIGVYGCVSICEDVGMRRLNQTNPEDLSTRNVPSSVESIQINLQGDPANDERTDPNPREDEMDRRRPDDGPQVRNARRPDRDPPRTHIYRVAIDR